MAKDVEEPLELIGRIQERFVTVERALQHRHDARTTLSVQDEYDIQDLLRSLLLIHFDDVSAEDPGAKFGGSSTRIDLLLRKERIVIEVKKMRSDMTERCLGKELKLDIVDYKQSANCAALVIVIDDRAGQLKNPKGFADDLRKWKRTFVSKCICCDPRCGPATVCVHLNCRSNVVRRFAGAIGSVDWRGTNAVDRPMRRVDRQSDRLLATGFPCGNLAMLRQLECKTSAILATAVSDIQARMVTVMSTRKSTHGAQPCTRATKSDAGHDRYRWSRRRGVESHQTPR